MLNAQNYVIRQRDTLSAIAEAHKLAGWQALYFASCNKDFRRRNPDPDKILVGQKILIPSNPAEQRNAVNARLTRLRAVRKSTDGLWREQERVIEQHFGEVKRTGQTVDAAATLVLLINSLAQLTYKGFQAMKLTEEALEQSNKLLAKQTLGGIAKTHGRDNAALVVSKIKIESTNTVWLITKSVAQSWCDMTSPSFWANTVTNVVSGKSWSQSVTDTPEVLRQKMKEGLASASRKALSGVDKKIQEAEKELRSIH